MTADPMLGRIVEGKYRIDAVIGIGGMATVYRATRLRIGDAVAMKILHGELLREPKFAERFEREAQAAARLKHPNVVAVYDFGVSEDGVIYLVMELVEGRNLHDAIKTEAPMPIGSAAAIVRQICAALAEAHRHDIVHRDIKPANIVVDDSPDGVRVKVLDFGIASLRGGTMMTFTQTGTVMGTPAYMSPEQCLGEDLDGRSDVYSLGVVLFEMLCGVVPFNSPTATAVVMQHVQQEPPPLRVLNISVPAPVERVVLRALAKRREDRPQSARALADELGAAVAGITVPADDDRTQPALAPFSASQGARTMQIAPAGSDHPAAPSRTGRFAAIAGAVAAGALAVAWLVLQSHPGHSGNGGPRSTSAADGKIVGKAGGSAAQPPLAMGHPQAPEDSATSVAFVRSYYRLWNARDFPAMYAMLSERMQRKNPYPQYVKYHSLVTRIDAAVAPADSASAVNVHIVSHDLEKDGSISESVNDGRWFLTMQSGTLKLDDQKVHEVRTAAAAVAVAPPQQPPQQVDPVQQPQQNVPVQEAPVQQEVSPQQAASLDVVRSYYALWNRRDFPTMYGMLSVRMQQKNPYDLYVKYHSLVQRIDAEVSPGFNPYVVNVRITSQDLEKDGSITRSVNEGQWFLDIEDGQLKLDNQIAHEVK